MSSRQLIIAFLLLVAPVAYSQEDPLRAPAGPVGDANPLLCLEAGGPRASVTALAFSPDGQTLYSAGYDKVVRVWRRDPIKASFQADPRATFRVPIGPGRDGVINVLAVSPDGAWLAVSGLGVYRGASDFGRPGWIVPDDALTPEMRQERSLIYLFNTQSHAVALLRGHEEDVLALAFAPSKPGQPQLLFSVSRKKGARSGALTGRICAWDADRASALNDKGDLVDRGAKVHDWHVTDIAPVPGEPLPGLAVRLTPEGTYRVITAWGDGKLRIGEFGPAGPVIVDEPRNADGRSAEYTQTVVAASGRLVTGGYVRGKGYVQGWDDVTDRVPRASSLIPLSPPRGVDAVLPRAMSLISSGDGRGLDHAALVLRSPARQGAGQEYRLALLGLKDFTLIGRLDDAALLGTWTKPPIMTSSPDGRFVAVTGDQNREIRVYVAGDLFGKLPEVIPLRSAGASAASVAFAHKGQPADLGLVLRAVPGQLQAPAPDDLVLDVGKRSLTPNPDGQGWKLVTSADAGWRVSLDASSPNVFHWVGPQTRGTARLRLQPAQVISAYALIPPRQPLIEPVLAVATWDSKIGEPQLGLFRATTGEQLRQLNGHVQPINSLAATPDGRLLASAAEDQTVCVWAMTDLADILGRHATLSGVTFRPGERSLVVARVDAESPVSGVLAADDVIQSVSFAGPNRKPRTVASPLEFFEALWGEKPGEKVRLNIRRGGAEQTVAVALMQSVDERKPLLSLFVTRDRMPEWIAWTPIGPYDISNRAAERYLGWHFNPSRLGEPVRFARADAYRERLHKPGLLKPLLTHANLTDALRELDKPVSLPRATIFCAVDAAAPVRFTVGSAEEILIRQPRVKLRLRVQGPSLEKNEIESIIWRINDGLPYRIPLEGTAGETLVQDIDVKSWGRHRVQVCLRTREAEPQEVTRELVLRFQPPPPRIKLESPAQPRQVVREAQFRFKAVVEPGSPGLNVGVILRKGQTETQLKQLNVDESVTLAPGENVLELRAANDDALRGYEEFETDRRIVVLVFQPKDGPQLLIGSLTPLSPSGAAIEIEPGRPAIVGAGKVRIKGRITATEPLTLAELGGKPLSGFQPNAAKEFAIDEEVALKPESQDLLFGAKTANSVETETRLTIVHRPPLPVLTLTDPDPDRSLTEGKDAREVEMRGSLSPPEGLPAFDLQPYQVVLRVTNQGRPVLQGDGQETVVLPSDRLTPVGVLAAKVRLRPGDNRIDVTVRNRWQEARAIERHVFYRRPPRFNGALKTSPPDVKPFTDVIADVESVSDLARVECNGREYPIGDVAAKVGESNWRVTLPKVPLVPGRNAIRLVVSNRDGPCLVEGRADVSVLPVKHKPPHVELLNRPQGAVKEPNFLARFLVRSTGSRIQRVELRQDSRVLASIEPKDEENEPDNFTSSGALGPVALQEGANRLRLVAVNGGGEAEQSFTIAHVPVPEWLEIDRPSLPQQNAEFTLTGRLTWTGSARAPEFERKLQRLRVYVNSGFQQQTPTLSPRRGTAGEGAAATNRLDFSVKVILNRQKDNLVEVVCPDLRPEVGGQQRFTVDCVHPREEPRTLHLLVVAVTPALAESTDKDLALRALKALQARGAGPQGLRSTVFQRLMMHPYVQDQPTQVVSGYVTCEHIRDALESIRRHSKPNDMALIYWLGSEAVNERGDLFLHTSESRPGRKLAHSAIALKEILEFPRDTPGACALLLDTAAAGAAPDTPAGVPLPSTRVAVLRYAWSGSGVTVPGLLLALEESSQKREATALQDLAAIAARTLKTFENFPTWEDNLKELPALADLVISRKP